MNITQRIKAFSRLGSFLKATTCNDNYYAQDNSLSDADYDEFKKLIQNIHLKNPWFTAENVRNAVYAIADNLSEENLNKWINKEINKNQKLEVDTKRFLFKVVMAGNNHVSDFMIFYVF